ncbi:unnamed protein product [Ambrosiozyma monospora]|uniref:Unnamed protein product n=1 Tax=Ambrosiozyma monospora TaxID=43982 RepID=A0A9W7DH91_AMBMO|nr:unnamed protein product [Ambrosiozyma monospora]
MRRQQRKKAGLASWLMTHLCIPSNRQKYYSSNSASNTNNTSNGDIKNNRDDVRKPNGHDGNKCVNIHINKVNNLSKANVNSNSNRKTIEFDKRMSCDKPLPLPPTPICTLPPTDSSSQVEDQSSSEESNILLFLEHATTKLKPDGAFTCDSRRQSKITPSINLLSSADLEDSIVIQEDLEEGKRFTVISDETTVSARWEPQKPDEFTLLSIISSETILKSINSKNGSKAGSKCGSVMTLSDLNTIIDGVEQFPFTRESIMLDSRTGKMSLMPPPTPSKNVLKSSKLSHHQRGPSGVRHRGGDYCHKPTVSVSSMGGARCVAFNNKPLVMGKNQGVKRSPSSASSSSYPHSNSHSRSGSQQSQSQPQPQPQPQPQSHSYSQSTSSVRQGSSYAEYEKKLEQDHDREQGHVRNDSVPTITSSASTLRLSTLIKSCHTSTRTSPTTTSYATTPTTSMPINSTSSREYPLTAVSSHRSSRNKPIRPVSKLSTIAIPISITPSRHRDPIPSASIGRRRVIA